MAASKARISNNQYKDHKAFVHANAQITYYIQNFSVSREEKKNCLVALTDAKQCFFLQIFSCCILHLCVI